MNDVEISVILTKRDKRVLQEHSQTCIKEC